MTSPLIPVPQVPWRTDGLPGNNYSLLVNGFSDGQVIVTIGNHDIELSPEQATEAAAALLAAAGSTARVIDLGEPLPEVVRDPGGERYTWDEVGACYDAITDESIRKETLFNLAVLEARDKARAAKPARDPAEVEAVIEVIRGDDPSNGKTWRERALDAIDALDRVRGGQS